MVYDADGSRANLWTEPIDDGNQISDGRWTNIWAAENRLIQMVSLTNAPSGSKLRLSFSYDSQGRRITKQVESWTGSAWSVISSNKFLYDVLTHWKNVTRGGSQS